MAPPIVTCRKETGKAKNEVSVPKKVLSNVLVRLGLQRLACYGELKVFYESVGVVVKRLADFRIPCTLKVEDSLLRTE